MPSFELCVLGAPIGFNAACEAINILVNKDSDEFCDLIRAIKKSTRDKTFYIPSNNDDLNNKIVSVVKYLGRCFDETEINLKIAAKVLDSNTILTRESIESFLFTWGEDDDGDEDDDNGHEENHNEKNKRLYVIPLGHTLKDIKWEIGVRSSSSSSSSPEDEDSANSIPYVRLDIITCHENSKPQVTTLDLSIEEFFEFQKSFKEAAVAMDTIVST